jgi:hypothetical protein
MVNQRELPRDSLPHGTFRLSDLPEEVPNYSGDIDGIDVDEVPRGIHMAFAIALTNVDQHMAYPNTKRDTLDALVQVWRAVAQGDVEVEYNRMRTRVEKLE